MEKSRTLVLVATMRSPTIGSLDQTIFGLAAPSWVDLGERPHPIFPHARRPRRGPKNLSGSTDEDPAT